MNNSKIITVSTGEAWIGLIDGTYAIIITLLVIELPTLIIKVINSANENFGIFQINSLIALHLIRYLFATIIIYDWWSLHKGYLKICKASRFTSILSMFILFFSSLMPPFLYIVNHLAQSMILADVNTSEIQNLVINQEYLYSRFSLLITILIIYFLFFILVRNQLFRIKKKENKNFQELKITSKIIIYRLIFTILILPLAVIDNPIIADIPIFLIALFTLVPLDTYGNLLKKI